MNLSLPVFYTAQSRIFDAQSCLHTLLAGPKKTEIEIIPIKPLDRVIRLPHNKQFIQQRIPLGAV